VASHLFKLRNVPDDEADEIRELLTEHDISFYETSPGIFGLSAPSIWLHDKEQLAEAKQLLNTYHSQRQEDAQRTYAEQVASGQQRTFLDLARENPARFVIYIVIIALILYFSIKPFIHLGATA